MKTALWLALATLCLAAPASARSRDFVIADATVDPRDSRLVKVEFAAGEMKVLGSDDDRIHIELTAECEHDRKSCYDKAERIRVVTQYASDAYRIRLENANHVGTNKPNLTLIITVPRNLAVSVDMKAGELDVRGLENDVEVEMAAGDISVELPEETVRTVDVRVSVGDASLTVPGPDPEAEGWLSKRIHWRDGRGEAMVKVGLAAGDVNVRLR